MKKSLLAALMFTGAIAAVPAHATIISDIVMLVDESGSMSDVQTNLRNNIGTFASILAAGGVDARFALVGYGSSSVAPHLITDFTTASGFATAAQSLVVNGGTEPGFSAVAFALNAIDSQSTLLSYRSNALKNIILFTDEPSNGDNCSGCLTGGNSTTFLDADSLLTQNNALFNAVLRSTALNTTVYGLLNSGYPNLAANHSGNVYDLNGLNTTDQTVVGNFVTTFAQGKLQETIDFCTANPNDPACQGTPTPEPASLALLGIGLFGLGAMRNRKAK